MKKQVVNIKLTSKQIEAINFLYDDSTTEILYGGSAGSGKSFLGCLWIISSALKYKNTRWLIGRKNITTLKLTTLKTFFEVAKLFKLEADSGYNYNQSSNLITLKNGSEIILKDLDYYPSDPNFDNLGSLEITGAFIDEIPQISEKAKNMVASRIRFKLDEYKLIPKLFMSCNPSKTWLYEKFYKKWEEGKLPDYQKFIPALPTDNPFISVHYINQLGKLDEQSKQRLLFGNWNYSSENVLFQFDNILNSFTIIKNQENKKYLTIDVARKNDKSVVFVWDGLNIIDGFWTNHTNFLIQIDRIKNLISKYNINKDNILVDSDGIGSPLNDLIGTTKEFHNNAKPLNDENYNNIKSQLYFKLADKINNNEIKINVELFSNEEQFQLITELENHKQDDIDSDGKVKITPKDKIKQLIGRSPDFADAMMMRMYFEIAVSAPLNFQFVFA